VTRPGGPDRRGRHSSADGAAGAPEDAQFAPRSIDGFAPGHQAPRYEASRYEPARFAVADRRPAAADPAERSRHSFEVAERVTSGIARSGVAGQHPDATGPMPQTGWWGPDRAGGTHGHSDGYGDTVGQPLLARHGEDRTGDRDPVRFSDTEHPSGPLPPRPTGVWDRLTPRSDVPADGVPVDDAPTVATPAMPPAPGHDADELTEAHHLDGDWDDAEETGGLEVIGAHVEDRDGGYPHDGDHLDADTAGPHDDDIPIVPFDPRSSRRRRRRPLALLVSLLVLGGLVAGIVIGGQKLLGLIDPSAQDFTGQGSGEVEIRVREGDTLSDIARTLVDAGVIASIGPFIDAAEAEPDATGIQPGVYSLREEMSGRSALDRMLDPAARLVSRITVPEGLTAAATFVRLSEATGRPVEEFEAAAADTAALGLPEWAAGSVEGFLFPATYDLEPDTTPAQIVQAMVARAQQAFADLQIPEDRLREVLTEASIIQAEAASAEDMAKVARVLENRIAIDMPLQLDTTVNYANGKSGITTTAEDRANPSPYNTYVHSGLPPGPISNPGEQALQASLTPAEGDWLFFVVVDPDTGETRFAATAEEHAANVEIFRQWLRENPDE
jgi:UPF0755 protein